MCLFNHLKRKFLFVNYGHLKFKEEFTKIIYLLAKLFISTFFSCRMSVPKSARSLRLISADFISRFLRTLYLVNAWELIYEQVIVINCRQYFTYYVFSMRFCGWHTCLRNMFTSLTRANTLVPLCVLKENRCIVNYY